MTTIIADHGLIVADRRATSNGAINLLPPFTKVRRLPDGSLMGGSGDLGEVIASMDWFASGQDGDEPKMKGAHLIQIRPDGSAVEYIGTATAIPILLPYAMGSGASYAMGAIAAGASVEDAMAIAHQHDCYTGSEIDVLRLEA